MSENGNITGFGSINVQGRKNARGAVIVSVEGNISILKRLTASLVLSYPRRLTAVLQVDAPFTARLTKACKIVYDITKRLTKACTIDAPILGVNRLTRALRVTYPILGQAAIVVTGVPKITIRGQTVAILSGSVDQDEGQYAWTCTLRLKNPSLIALFKPDDVFTVDVNGETYDFIVDSTSKSRTQQVQREATVSGISPSAVYASPRAQKITNTWGQVTALGVVESLLPVDWFILNWSIPAFRLGAQNETPMDVLHRIARAAGATVQCEPNGDIAVRYLYPTPVPQYASAVPDQTYNHFQHVISPSERTVTNEFVNRLRILDVQPSANSDVIEFEQDKSDLTKGVLRVYPKPWRETVVVSHTSSAQVSVKRVGVVTEELEETVEVIAGKGSVSKPIYQLISVTYLYANLGGVAFESDSNEFATNTASESLVKIKYRTRRIEYTTVAFLEAEVQYLVKDTDDAVQSGGTDVIVQRGAGDRQGEDIVDSLITSDAVAVQRGRNELDRRASAPRQVQEETVYRTGVRIGHLAEFADGVSGEVWRGKVTGISHVIDGVKLTTKLTVERPTNFYGE